jgi:hypothetical protein
VEVQKVDAGAVKGRVCACTKDGSTARLVLTVEERTATGDAPRIATLKAHYNGLIQTLQGGGFTELKGSRPGITAPIPDRASFEVLGKNAEGKPFFVKSVTVFGKGIYLFQAFADSKEEADPLAKVAESLKELDPQGK